MNVNELLDTIEDTLAESANMPLSGGKRIVDVDQIQEYLDEIRANLPGELRQAQAIVNDRAQIVDSANAQAKAIIRQAEEMVRAYSDAVHIEAVARNEGAIRLYRRKGFVEGERIGYMRVIMTKPLTPSEDGSHL